MAPEPLPVGYAINPSAPSTSDTMTNSVRPSSEAIRTGTRALTLASERGGRPAIRRSTGTIMSWKVNIAEVGNPGRMITGLPSHTARHSGLPGFSATPWAMMPGLPSRPMMRWDTSPAPFDVPPDSTSMSLVSSALRIADSSCASSSGMAPRKCASPPFSEIAAVTIAPLVS